MSGDIYHDIRKLCNDVFCRKETLCFEFLVSMPKQLPPTPKSVSFSVWTGNSQPIYCLGRSIIGGKFIENPGYILARLTMICGKNINPSCLAGLTMVCTQNYMPVV